MNRIVHMNFYERLGVARNATTEEIRSAYADIARVYHPDSHFFDDLLTEEQRKVTPRQEEIFRLVTEAYNTLIHKEQRAKYDRSLPAELDSWDTQKMSDTGRLKLKEKMLQKAKNALREAEIEVEFVREEELRDEPTAIMSVADMIAQERQKARRNTSVFQVERRKFPVLAACLTGGLLILACAALFLIVGLKG